MNIEKVKVHELVEALESVTLKCLSSKTLALEDKRALTLKDKEDI